MPALQADRVVDAFGVCCSGGTTTPNRLIDGFTYLGLRHARVGRVNVGGAQQRAQVQALASIGVGICAICDDRGVDTPATRLTEALTQWGGATLDYIEGANEPQRSYGTPAQWPMTVSSNGPLSTDTNLGVNETRRQAPLVWATRNTQAPTVPVLHSSLATKNKTGWYARLGDLSAYCTHGNVHCYAGGQPLTKDGAVAGYVAETVDVAGPGKPTVVTECGYYDYMPDTSGSNPTPPAVQAVYFPRGLLELLDVPGLERAYFYELIDDSTAAAGKEQHFGLFTPASGDTLTPKASAQAIARTTALYADPGSAFTPGSLAVLVGDAPNLQWRLHQKRNGTFLLALWRTESVYDPATQATLTVADASVTVALPPSASTTVHRVTPGTTTGPTTGSVTVPVGADLTVLAITA